jgi:hypothetical protein
VNEAEADTLRLPQGVDELGYLLSRLPDIEAFERNYDPGSVVP